MELLLHTCYFDGWKSSLRYMLQSLFRSKVLHCGEQVEELCSLTRGAIRPCNSRFLPGAKAGLARNRVRIDPAVGCMLHLEWLCRQCPFTMDLSFPFCPRSLISLMYPFTAQLPYPGLIVCSWYAGLLPDEFKISQANFAAFLRSPRTTQLITLHRRRTSCVMSSFCAT